MSRTGCCINSIGSYSLIPAGTPPATKSDDDVEWLAVCALNGSAWGELLSISPAAGLLTKRSQPHVRSPTPQSMTLLEADILNSQSARRGAVNHPIATTYKSSFFSSQKSFLVTPMITRIARLLL